MLASSSSDEEVDDHSQQQSSIAISSSAPLGPPNRSVRTHPSRGSYTTAPGQIIRNAPLQPQQQGQQQHNGSKYRQVFSSTSSRSSIRSNDNFDGINVRSR